MTAPLQIIRSPDGVEMVVLPRADYDALAARAADADEDAADAATYAASKRDLAAGLDTVLPPEVSAALLKGDRLLKALRKWRGVTQVDLAARTGLAQGYLSDIERGEKSAPSETLTRIADALDVPIDWLR